MAGVEEELWNIFTFYTLRGSPLDLTRLSFTQFLRLARDCQIVDGGVATVEGLPGRSAEKPVPRSKRPERRLGQAAVNLTFTAVVQGQFQVVPEGFRNRRKQAKARLPAAHRQKVMAKPKLNYPEFLDAIVILGERMYGKGAHQRPGRGGIAKTRTAVLGSDSFGKYVAATFQELLMEKILPLASRRRPVSVAAEMRDPLVRNLLRHYAPAFREIFRFYAASSSAVGKKTSPSSRRSGESDEKEVACADPINSRNDEDRTQNHPPSDFDKRSPLPQHSEVVATSPTKTFMEDALVSAPPDIEKRDEKLATDVADGIAQSLVEPTTPPATPDHLALDPPPLADGVDGNFGAKASDGDVLTRGGRRESSDGVQRRHTPLLAAGTPMNSMADALSHRSLLHFAADFGISGALLSALEVGEIFFSCEGELDKKKQGRKGTETDALDSQGAWRTGLARAGKGGVRPLSFLEFLEALVRISMACFGQRGDDEIISPGHYLRALVTYIWQRLHTSAELALNGVRAGGMRYRSSIQKGAFLKGVKMFNDRMISRWRAEGFLDFAATRAAATKSTSLRVHFLYPPRQGYANEILRRLLTVDNDHVEEREAGDLVGKGGGGDGKDQDKGGSKEEGDIEIRAHLKGRHGVLDPSSTFLAA